MNEKAQHINSPGQFAEPVRSEADNFIVELYDVDRGAEVAKKNLNIESQSLRHQDKAFYSLFAIDQPADEVNLDTGKDSPSPLLGWLGLTMGERLLCFNERVQSIAHSLLVSDLLERSGANAEEVLAGQEENWRRAVTERITESEKKRINREVRQGQATENRDLNEKQINNTEAKKQEWRKVFEDVFGANDRTEEFLHEYANYDEQMGSKKTKFSHKIEPVERSINESEIEINKQARKIASIESWIANTQHDTKLKEKLSKDRDILRDKIQELSEKKLGYEKKLSQILIKQQNEVTKYENRKNDEALEEFGISIFDFRDSVDRAEKEIDAKIEAFLVKKNIISSDDLALSREQGYMDEIAKISYGALSSDDAEKSLTAIRTVYQDMKTSRPLSESEKEYRQSVVYVKKLMLADSLADYYNEHDIVPSRNTNEIVESLLELTKRHVDASVKRDKLIESYKDRVKNSPKTKIKRKYDEIRSSELAEIPKLIDTNINVFKRRIGKEFWGDSFDFDRDSIFILPTGAVRFSPDGMSLAAAPFYDDRILKNLDPDFKQDWTMVWCNCETIPAANSLAKFVNETVDRFHDIDHAHWSYADLQLEELKKTKKLELIGSEVVTKNGDGRLVFNHRYSIHHLSEIVDLVETAGKFFDGINFSYYNSRIERAKEDTFSSKVLGTDGVLPNTRLDVSTATSSIVYVNNGKIIINPYEIFNNDENNSKAYFDIKMIGLAQYNRLDDNEKQEFSKILDGKDEVSDKIFYYYSKKRIKNKILRKSVMTRLNFLFEFQKYVEKQDQPNNIKDFFQKLERQY